MARGATEAGACAAHHSGGGGLDKSGRGGGGGRGRVRPTTQAKGDSINADEGLEREADVMGAKALGARQQRARADALPVAQCKQGWADPVAQYKSVPSHHAPGVNRRAGVIQLKLDEEVKINTFMEDLGADKKDHDLKNALTALLSAAQKSKFDIEYSWLKTEVNKKSLNVPNVRKLKDDLDNR